MDQLKTNIAEFIADLRAQKLRAFLTMFGIIWGTFSIIVLIAFGVGFQRQTSINMHGIGESIAIMFPGKTTKPWEGFGLGREISFTEEDINLLTQQVPELETISPEYATRSTARLGENMVNPLVAGVVPLYHDMRNIIPMPGGRFLNDLDIQQRRRVVFIGDKVKEHLFGESDPIGKTIFIGTVPFMVIGHMQEKTQNSSYNARDRDRIFIPTSTFSSVFGTMYLNNIIYKVKDPLVAEEINDKVRSVLAKRYRFDPTDEDAVWIWDTSEMDKFMFYLFLGFNAFMGLIGSFTLGVAGIGVANIMFIVVQERIREIGIKRAVGAKKSTILIQFFLETFFIVFLGSAVGFLFAVGIVYLLQFIPIKEYIGSPTISTEVVLVTVTILMLVGLLAGFMPARRAANLNVVECLR